MLRRLQLYTTLLSTIWISAILLLSILLLAVVSIIAVERVAGGLVVDGRRVWRGGSAIVAGLTGLRRFVGGGGDPACAVHGVETAAAATTVVDASVDVRKLDVKIDAGCLSLSSGAGSCREGRSSERCGAMENRMDAQGRKGE